MMSYGVLHDEAPTSITYPLLSGVCALCSPIYVRHMEYTLSCHTCHRPVFFWLLPAGSCLCLWIIWSVHLLMASRAVSSRDKCPISVPLLKSRACHPVWYKERWIYLDCIRPEVLWSGDFLPRFFKYLQYHLGSLSFVIILAFLLVYLHSSG